MVVCRLIYTGKYIYIIFCLKSSRKKGFKLCTQFKLLKSIKPGVILRGISTYVINPVFADEILSLLTDQS